MPSKPATGSSTAAPSEDESDVLLIGAYLGDDGPIPAGVSGLGPLDDLVPRLGSAGFKGKLGEVTIVPPPDGVAAKAVAVVGLGKEDKVSESVIRRASGSAGRKLADRSTIAIALPNGERNTFVEAAAEGVLLGSYRFTTYKSDAKPSKIEHLTFFGDAAAAAERGSVRAKAAMFARDLINEPASTLTPAVFAERIEEVALASGLEVEVWGPQELESRGFGGLLGVSQGSEQEPRFIQLRYAPKSGATKKIALVGKGVTYDTGGYSLKPPASMEQMKTDMSGAAAVIATMSALGDLEVDREVLGFIPATENLISGKAIKPGDVLRHYGGKTTEVMNTDAEGRLILADALAFASEQGPDAIVDLATLTGSMTVALGNKASGVFVNDEPLSKELLRAAEEAGEQTWRMPLWDDNNSELESEIADFKNVGSRYGGAITAAIFLQHFVGEGIPWAHFDIAGPARSESDRDEISRGGTAVGVRTLLKWLEGNDG
jgi:leucyl aminopeptidase